MTHLEGGQFARIVVSWPGFETVIGLFEPTN